jgi:hypothetical protein
VSSINPVFQPMTPTYAVDNTAGGVSVNEAVQAGATVFRIRAIKASGYISWYLSPHTPAAPSAPAVGTPAPNTVGVELGKPIYLELPPGVVFIGNAAFATSSFEVTGGQGGASSG